MITRTLPIPNPFQTHQKSRTVTVQTSNYWWGGIGWVSPGAYPHHPFPPLSENVQSSMQFCSISSRNGVNPASSRNGVNPASLQIHTSFMFFILWLAIHMMKTHANTDLFFNKPKHDKTHCKLFFSLKIKMHVKFTVWYTEMWWNTHIARLYKLKPDENTSEICFTLSSM